MTQMPHVWIGTSWKMNKTLGEARAFAGGLLADPQGDPRIQRFVIPPFTAAREVKAMLKDTSVKVGAQNMHWADDGAWTGEISPLMLKDCDLDIVELGHSERREHFGETQRRYLRGVTMGISWRNNHLPYATRTVWHYLGKVADKRGLISRCGIYPLNSAALPAAVLSFLTDASPIVAVPLQTTTPDRRANS